MSALALAWQADAAVAAFAGQSSQMKLLVGTGYPDFARYGNHPAMGRLIQPRDMATIEKVAEEGICWAADNDCFQGLDARAYDRMLDRITGLPGCRFVTVPDVVADARATAFLFERWAPAVERRGLPVGLVLQDGLTVASSWLARTWHRLDAVFVGGSTEWKLGGEARALVREAQRRGLWVHVGRVNTDRRIDYCRDVLEADSVDGTKWCKFKATYLADGLARVGRPRNLTLDI